MKDILIFFKDFNHH